MTPWASDSLTSESFETPLAPATCVFNNHLYLFWRSNDSFYQIYFSYLDKPGKIPVWLAARHANRANFTSHTVAACAFKNRLYLFWAADDLRGSIYYSASSDGETWPDGQPVGQSCGSPHTPAACVFHEKLYLFWDSNDSSHSIEFTCLDPSAAIPSWSAPRQINDLAKTERPIATSVFNDKLYLFWAANDSTNWIYFSGSSDGENWPKVQARNAACASSVAPSACVFQNHLFLFWKANDANSTLYWTNVPAEGETWPDGQPVNQSGTSPEAPSACVFQNEIYLFWKANDDTNFIYGSHLGGEPGWAAN